MRLSGQFNEILCSVSFIKFKESLILTLDAVIEFTCVILSFSILIPVSFICFVPFIKSVVVIKLSSVNNSSVITLPAPTGVVQFNLPSPSTAKNWSAELFVSGQNVVFPSLVIESIVMLLVVNITSSGYGSISFGIINFYILVF